VIFLLLKDEKVSIFNGAEEFSWRVRTE